MSVFNRCFLLNQISGMQIKPAQWCICVTAGHGFKLVSLIVHLYVPPRVSFVLLQSLNRHMHFKQTADSPSSPNGKHSEPPVMYLFNKLVSGMQLNYVKL